jgi:hypothetical protein
MEAVREVTVWPGIDYAAPNHDYLLDTDAQRALAAFQGI